MDAISIFNSVRDIHYKIPLSLQEKDNCCNGKHQRLFNILASKGYDVRYRVCVFLWSDLGLPKKLEKIPHEDRCTHVYLEIKIHGKWKVLDATWDKRLKNIFLINEWDGKSSTELAVKPVKIYSPKKSLALVNEQNTEEIKRDLRVNGRFYESFNKWLEENRKKRTHAFR